MFIVIPGYYEITNSFKIAFGCWRVSFNKDELIKYIGEKFYRYSCKRDEWIEVKPPFSEWDEHDKFTFDRWGGYYDQKTQYEKFKKNTKYINDMHSRKLKELLMKKRQIWIDKQPVTNGELKSMLSKSQEYINIRDTILLDIKEIINSSKIPKKVQNQLNDKLKMVIEYNQKIQTSTGG